MDNAVENASGLNKKFIFIGGAILVLFLILILILVASSKKKNTTKLNIDANSPLSTVPRSTYAGTQGSNTIRDSIKQNNNQGTIDKIVPVNIAAARIALDWTDKQRGDQGRYNSALLCDKNNKCDVPTIDNRVGLAVAWGRFKYYLQTKDPQDLIILQKDIDILDNSQITEVIQNDFWNCKFMYEMYNGTDLIQTTKDKIKNICLKSSNYPLTEMNLEDPSNIVVEDNGANIDKVIKGQRLAHDPMTDSTVFTSYATSASDKAIKYIWNRNIMDLKASQIYFNKALALYSTDKTQIGDESSLLGVAAVDLFNATKNNKYLSFAYVIYKDNSQRLCATQNGCIGIMALSNDLYNLVKDIKYKNFEVQTIGYLIDNKFDQKLRTGFVNDQSAFYYLNNGKYIYSVRNNGIIAGYLSQ